MRCDCVSWNECGTQYWYVFDTDTLHCSNPHDNLGIQTVAHKDMHWSHRLIIMNWVCPD